MKTYIIGFLFLVTSNISLAQTSTGAKKMFANTWPLINKYRADCQKAWDNKNEKLAYTYYDSISNCINNTYIGNHIFHTIDNRVFSTKSLKKPVFLIVSASWCEPCRAEIPAVTKIVEEYKNRIDFVMLFWDTKKTLVSLSEKYNRSIYLVPSITQTTDESHTINIAGFKHVIGYPTNYLISTNKQIIKNDQGASVATTYTDDKGKIITNTVENAFNLNYKRLKDDAELLLSKGVVN